MDIDAFRRGGGFLLVLGGGYMLLYAPKVEAFGLAIVLLCVGLEIIRRAGDVEGIGGMIG